MIGFKRIGILLFTGVLLLAGCESVTNSFGKVTYYNKNFNGTKEIVKLELKEDKNISIPYEVIFQGEKGILKVVHDNYTFSETDNRFTDILIKEVYSGEKGELEFIPIEKGEYNITFTSDHHILEKGNSVEVKYDSLKDLEIKLNVKGLDYKVDGLDNGFDD